MSNLSCEVKGKEQSMKYYDTVINTLSVEFLLHSREREWIIFITLPPLHPESSHLFTFYVYSYRFYFHCFSSEMYGDMQNGKLFVIEGTLETWWKFMRWRNVNTFVFYVASGEVRFSVETTRKKNIPCNWQMMKHFKWVVFFVYPLLPSL